MIINEVIKKSFFDILSPPFVKIGGSTQLLNVPEYDYIKQMYILQ